VRPEERLSYYARYFTLVEVDSSYYKIPDPRAVDSWVRQTPDDFIFDVKAFRTLTKHDRGKATPDELESDFQAFETAVSVLRASGKLGFLLFQFPPWFVHNRDHQDYVERVRYRFPDDRVAIEFRNRTWWTEEQWQHTVGWLSSLDAVNVVCDEPQVGSGTIPFVSEVTSRRGVMFRLHGRNVDTWYQKGLESSQQRFDYLYRKEELSEFLPHVHAWAREAAEVHILMNNNQGDYAIQNAFDWLNLLGVPHKPRPVLQQTIQTSLFDTEEEL
jgi:uncharacterized protein YecE (DUF72 family)